MLIVQQAKYDWSDSKQATPKELRQNSHFNYMAVPLTKCELGSYRNYSSLREASVILTNAQAIAASFLEIYTITRTNIQGKKMRGPSLEQQQDLLRAMLLFSAAGLDASVKRLIKDAYKEVITKDIKAHLEFEKYIERKIKRVDDSESEEKRDLPGYNIKFIAKALGSDNPKEELVKERIADLTEKSLQSIEGLGRVAEALGIDRRKILLDELRLKQSFRARNEIAHEMDMDLSQPQGDRRSRTQQEMVDYSNAMLLLARRFIKKTFEKIG